MGRPPPEGGSVAYPLQTRDRCGWNHSRAAEALGIGRTTLWRKLKEYGLE
jgi:transcriptional regulator of acetoin/glycerol metabolism